MNLNPFASLTELAQGLERGDYSSSQIVNFYFKRIRELDGKAHSYVHVYEDRALRAAVAADRRRAVGHSLGPLDGLPIAVKDLFDVEGEVTTSGSQAWLNRRATSTSTVVQRLEEAGMCLLGKLHMVEFAFGAWGLNPLMGTPRNPWDVKAERIPGGSSSGCGVAVAAGLAPAAIGTDTGGSVRTPAALNGITGLKCTAGLIDLAGALPLCPALDSVGPLCRTAADASLILSVISNGSRNRTHHDPRFAPDFGLRDLQIFVLDEAHFPIEVSAEIQEGFHSAQYVLSSCGALLTKRPIPFDFDYIAQLSGEMMAAAAWDIHGGYIEDDEQLFGPWVRKRITSGKTIDSSRFATLQRLHEEYCQAWRNWITPGSALLLPALPMVACRFDEADEASTKLGAFARAANFVGACSITFPVGQTRTGMPVAMQLMSGPFDEEALLRICSVFQSITDWHLRTPPQPDGALPQAKCYR